jgi:hypothetical protein
MGVELSARAGITGIGVLLRYPVLCPSHEAFTEITCPGGPGTMTSMTF